jgi:hypothetical protein
MSTESRVQSTPKIEVYRQLINASYRKTTTHLFELAAVCREAADSLSTAQVQELLTSELFIDRSTFWKYVKIGRDSRLQGISDKLPPSLSIAYEVAQLKDDQLREAVDTNAIHPNARRSVIVALRKQSPNRGEETPNQTQTPKQPALKIEAGRRYWLNIPGDANDDICAQIAKVLESLCAKFGPEITLINESGAVLAQAPPPSSPVNHHFSGLSERLKSSTSLSSGAQNGL